MSSSAYRDRARERREAEGKDEEGEEGGGVAARFAVVGAAGAAGAADGERHREEIERSKFLGGTEEHTHLVKGLDFALLRRVREEIQLREREDEEEALEEAARAEEEARTSRRGAPVDLAPARTPLGRAAQRWLLGVRPAESAGPSRVERFLPGRTVYTFNLDPRAPDLPQVSMRSAENSERLAPRRAVDPDIMRRLIAVLSSERAAKMRKMRKKEKRAQLAKLMREEEEAMRASLAVAGAAAGPGAAEGAGAEADPDDDMFADDDDGGGGGGEAVPAPGRAPAKWGGSYFSSGGRSDVRSAPRPAPEEAVEGAAAPAGDGGGGDGDGGGPPNEEAEARRQKLLGMMQDGYDECYPDYAVGFAGTFGDDDDDDDGGGGGAAGGGAAGAGAGAGDGKKRKRKMKNRDGSAMDEHQVAAALAREKKQRKDSKFASNFQKIQGIIKRREEERGGAPAAERPKGA